MGFKVNHIKEDLAKYSIALLGESGIGKTTIMKEICEREFREDGYVIFNTGREQGIDAIEGAVYADIPDWKTFEETVDDIIKNKQTEYKNLKVVVIDTLDQLIDIAAPETIMRWNRQNIGISKKDFIPAKTLNGSWGGFGKGEDANCQMILDRVWDLKKVGVTAWFIGHVKVRDKIDPITNLTYSSLTTDMAQRDFNYFKNKIHLVGIACIDRDIVTEDTGRKNVVTKKEITINKVKSESRKIMFRDDNYSVDSKSRFRYIVNEIPFDPDEFIKAVKDALNTEITKHRTGANNLEKKLEAEGEISTKATPSVVAENATVEKAEDTTENDDDELFGMNEPETVTPEAFKSAFMSCTDKTKKTKVAKYMKELGKKADGLTDEERQTAFAMLA